jgi:hypothetical protein
MVQSNDRVEPRLAFRKALVRSLSCVCASLYVPIVVVVLVRGGWLPEEGGVVNVLLASAEAVFIYPALTLLSVMGRRGALSPESRFIVWGVSSITVVVLIAALTLWGTRGTRARTSACVCALVVSVSSIGVALHSEAAQDREMRERRNERMERLLTPGT